MVSYGADPRYFSDIKSCRTNLWGNEAQSSWRISKVSSGYSSLKNVSLTLNSISEWYFELDIYLRGAEEQESHQMVLVRCL